MNQGFWMTKGAGCLNDGDMAYDNSSGVEPKRSYQWFMDGPETELFPNKKQAVNAVSTCNLFSGMLNSNVSPWGNTSGFHLISGHFSERLFDPETARTVNFDDQSMPSVSSEKVDMERNANEDLFGNDSSFGLSMSHTLEDPRSGLSYGGIRKVKVSQVKDSENMPVPMSHAYDRVDSNSLSVGHAYKVEDSSISMGLAYNKGNENIMSIGDTSDRDINVFISMGQSYNKGEEGTTVSETFKDGTNALAMGNTFDKTDTNFITMGQSYNRADENSISMCHALSKVDDSTISMGHTYDKGEKHTLSIGQSFSKGESTIISFGGYDDNDTNPSGSLISNYGLLVSQASIQRSEALDEKDAKLNAEELVSSGIVSASGAEVSRKKDETKTSKKVPSNNFPSNVRSLLSTGMLDGVPVKYTAWSREKELHGVIKGSGYQCGCQSCNFSNVINAYEFEQHAGCKTKHPNNHIYFENGKTVYGIVQELRSTPQNMLFDVIQTITGSPINQKSFRLWKESFLAATRELQRIYGNDGGKQLC